MAGIDPEPVLASGAVRETAVRGVATGVAPVDTRRPAELEAATGTEAAAGGAARPLAVVPTRTRLPGPALPMPPELVGGSGGTALAK